MRRLALFAGVVSLGSALCLAQAPAAGRGPSAALVKTACAGGLLVRPSESAPAGGGYEAEAESSFGGLFGSSGGDDKGEKGKGAKKPAARTPAETKPKTRLLRPRSDKDRAACPAQVRDFYEKYGADVTAVPAPESLPAEQIEANIDRVFGLAAGPGRRETLAKLKDGDLAARSAVVGRLFDGVKTLDAAAFEGVDRKAQALAAAKTGGVLGGGFEASPEGAQAPAGPAAADPAAPASPADPKTADSPLSDAQRQRFSRASAPPRLGGARPSYVPPAVGTTEPGPPAESYYNRYVPSFIQDAARAAGSWTADKLYGGGDPAVNVEMPADPQSPERWRRVRFGNYGTAAMIKGLVAVGTDMGRLGAPTLQIGDISQRGGGTFRRHLSHKIGKDVDVFFITDRRGRFDVPWNLTLAATAVKDMNVTRIFVDTPLKNYMTRYLAAHPEIPDDERAHMAKALSKMSYWPGHDTHFHIRIDY